MRPDPLGDKRCAGRRLMHAAVAGIALTACSSTAVRTVADYDRGSAPAEKIAKDADSCAKQADAHQKEYGLGPFDPTHGSYNWMYDSCMQAGGYQRKKP